MMLSEMVQLQAGFRSCSRSRSRGAASTSARSRSSQAGDRRSSRGGTTALAGRPPTTGSDVGQDDLFSPHDHAPSADAAIAEKLSNGLWRVWFHVLDTNKRLSATGNKQGSSSTTPDELPMARRRTSPTQQEVAEDPAQEQEADRYLHFLLWRGLDLISTLKFVPIEDGAEEITFSGGSATPGAAAGNNETPSWAERSKPFLDLMRPYLNSVLQLGSVATGAGLGEPSLELATVGFGLQEIDLQDDEMFIS
ncbi:unnamed protein product [Amoebophrya sp. A120]|nr:unnamed protein product [Amoebophrya sp. A120]|eukprot:GSA120T00021902001.1